jgi:hypothetical protein
VHYNATNNKKNQASAGKGLYVWILLMNAYTVMASTDISLTAQTKSMTALDLQSLTALGMNNNLFDNIVSITDIGHIIIKEETLVFEQKMNFELIFEELLKAKQLIETLNPNDFSDLVRLTGADSHFKFNLTPPPSPPSPF